MISPENTLAIQGLSVGYSRKGRMNLAVEDVSLSIPKGGRLGLMGESGSGKTTVAMALLRYLPRNASVLSGSVHFQGRDLLKSTAMELQSIRGRQLAAVYQDPLSSLNPIMPVGEQVAEVFRKHLSVGRAEAWERSLEALEHVELPNPAALALRLPHQLSGGQQQRVVIAMALAAEPSLLILDEPTTGLDATVEAATLELINALCAEQQTTLLLVSHNIGIVRQYCDSVSVMYAGRVVETGAVEDVLIRPQHPYTEALLNCVPTGHRKFSSPLHSITSAPPSPSLTRCGFFAGCERASEECKAGTVPMTSLANGREVRCLHPGPSVRPAVGHALDTSDATPQGSPLLSVKDLRKSYRSSQGYVEAVRGISFEVKRGETFAIVGESGSGKSTLAKCIAGLESFEGRIVLGGQELPGDHRLRHRTIDTQLATLVFQNPQESLNPSKTVSSVLMRSLKRAGVDESTLPGLIADVRLSAAHLKLKTRMLSGGLKQRVAIARAMVGSPSIIVCDEPVSALDVSIQAAVLNLLADYQRRTGTAFLFISHDMSVVRYIADRVGVMYKGEMVEIGSVESIFNSPSHPYTKALLRAAGIDGKSLTPDPSGQRGSSRELEQSGCAYSARCAAVLGDHLCFSEPPPWRHDEIGKIYRCHRLSSALVG
ncbi:ABC transporter ATP-binding protein [Mesorhizobium sp. DCY119]|uniref:dipeptide ABC transporter ATP-binding protein n=1 Tax=Mesorhizobium sp. DCY119 TaxID=2108445 RepID=UPI000E73E434|nr:ABC transporter ATP-binding protein [Mesorhizobium sp. DCY119]RJG40467.1 ABC transporter ATP-binding protein [Mesorhizobium sp. DCY119]